MAHCEPDTHRQSRAVKAGTVGGSRPMPAVNLSELWREGDKKERTSPSAGSFHLTEPHGLRSSITAGSAGQWLFRSELLLVLLLLLRFFLPALVSIVRGRQSSLLSFHEQGSLSKRCASRFE